MEATNYQLEVERLKRSRVDDGLLIDQLRKSLESCKNIGNSILGQLGEIFKTLDQAETEENKKALQILN